MDKETLNDLKQFITTTVHQEVAGINDRLDENDLKQNEILNAIGEVHDGQARALMTQANHIDDHERRIIKLEKRVA